MISTRSLYNADHDYYRRSERGLQMTIGPSSTLSEHCASASSSQRQSPALDLEPKAVASQRKRVPVACDRCRKRKIKCSGDEGGGRGCLNCRNAGWEGCQFLRVQSFSTIVNTAVVDNGRSWQAGNRYHPYSYHGQRTPNHTHVQSPYPPEYPQYSLWTNSTDYGQCSNPNQPSAYTRPSYASQYPIPFSSEPNYPYSNSAPPSYMLPDPEPAQHLGLNYMAPSHRPQQQHPVWLEQAHPIPVVSNNGQMSNAFSVGLGEGQSPYPTMLQSDSSVSPTERLLPTFNSSRIMPSVSMAASDSLPVSATSHRSSVGWLAETASNASATSSQPSCSGQQDASTPYSNPSCSIQDLSYGYSHVPGSAQSTVTTPVLRITNDDQQLDRPTHSMCSLSQAQQRYRGISYESAESSCSNSPSFSYNYNEATLQGQRNNQQSTSGSRHMPMLNSCVWNSTRELRSTSINEDCQHDSLESRGQSRYSPET